MSKVITESIENAAGYRTDAVHLIETIDSAGLSTVDFVLPDGYFKYQFILDEIIPVTDATKLYLRTSADGGSTFDSGAGAYQYRLSYNNVLTSGTSNTEIQISTAGGTSTGEGVSGDVHCFNPSGANYTRFSYQMTLRAADTLQYYTDGIGMRQSAAAVDAIRFFFSSGNFTSGTFKMYGWKS